MLQDLKINHKDLKILETDKKSYKVKKFFPKFVVD